MKIYNFNQFEMIDAITMKFLNDDISESEFKTYLNTNIINESVFINSIRDKILNILYTYIIKGYEIGLKIFDKFNIFFKWIINTLSKFKEKNPALYKIILLTVVTMIILLISAATSHAQINNKPIDKDKLDVAIGWLDYIKTLGKSDNMQVNKAIAHLIDLRDGKIDIPNFNKEALNMANSAVKVADKIIQNKTDKSISNLCVELINKGSEYLSAAYVKTSTTEDIKLLMK